MIGFSQVMCQVVRKTYHEDHLIARALRGFFMLKLEGETEMSQQSRHFFYANWRRFHLIDKEAKKESHITGMDKKKNFKKWMLVSFLAAFQSCMPYHSYETSRRSDCVFLLTKTFEIVQNCKEGKFNTFTGLKVEVRYDTIRIVNGKPSDGFTLFKSDGSISLPYKLNDSIIKNMGRKMSISIETDVREFAYSLSIDSFPKKDTLPFTFYYNK